MKANELLNIDIDDIKDAYNRIRNKVIYTPLLESNELNEKFNTRILIKAENLQKTGSFKYRGATNSITALCSTQKSKGIICFSSGNHGQAIAYAAKTLNTNAIVVMPNTAPKIKIDKTKKYATEVILFEGTRENMEKFTLDLSKKTGRHLIRPFDDETIIAGQGTIGIEITKELKLKKIKTDAVLVPCSGGGLLAGTSIAIKNYDNKIKMHPIEPEGFDDTARSLEKNKILINDNKSRSICDSLLVPKPGKLTFSINSKFSSKGFSVPDCAVYKAIKIAKKIFNLTLEPGGAIGLAAIINNQLPKNYKSVIVIASGGNIDPESFDKIINGKL